MKFNWRQNGSLLAIALVFLTTLYQIFPSLVYYAKPLDSPLEESAALSYYQDLVSGYEHQSRLQIEWLKGLCKNLKLKANFERNKYQFQLLDITFTSSEEKAVFEQYLPAAAQMASKLLGEMGLIRSNGEKVSKVVLASRWSDKELLNLPKTYTPTSLKSTNSAYQKALLTWHMQVLKALEQDPNFHGALGPVSELLLLPTSAWTQPLLEDLLRVLKLGSQAYLPKGYEQRQLNALFQGEEEPVHKAKILTGKLQEYAAGLVARSDEDKAKSKALKKQIDQAIAFLNKLGPSLAAQIATSDEKLAQLSAESFEKPLVILPFTHPIIKGIRWSKEASPKIEFVLHNDLADVLNKKATDEAEARAQEAVRAKLYNLTAYLQESNIGQITGADNFLALSLQAQAHSFWLLVDLENLMKEELSRLQNLLMLWRPSYSELQSDKLKVFTAEQFQDPSIPSTDKLICVVLDPHAKLELPEAPGHNSPRVVFKGFSLLTQTLETEATAFQEQFYRDFNELASLLESLGYSFMGSFNHAQGPWKGSGIFINMEPYSNLISRMNDWKLIGHSSLAFLGIDNYASWAKNVNEIENQKHLDLVRWYEDWRLASSDLNPVKVALAVKPPVNLLWNNFSLTWGKILRGDAKRILKWGLDLSGGKSVRLAIYDANSRRITDPELLIQSRNEIIERINKIGLAEIAAKIEGDHIVVDFPSSQGYSSKELLQATTMSFHLVNEFFSSPLSPHRSDVSEFLSNVWNEALITRRFDSKALSAIAHRRLKDAQAQSSDSPEKRLSAAGLEIAPESYQGSSDFSEEYSMIVAQKEDPRLGRSSRNPLLIVFRNWALQGSNLSSVAPSYDPQHGNILTFSVSDKGPNNENPQDTFSRWTSHFCAEQIQGSSLESLMQGRGFRMAVILNDEVISSPALSSALRDQAMIYGQFSPRDVAKLSAELKAGSLTFTPQILSEENISPELGLQDRSQGIKAAFIAFIAVLIVMVLYYRFGGFVAAIAVTFNLLIQWAVLQNLGAALTLPGLAGVVLAMGMAVDANVLVFERIREELNASRQLLQAIRAGYSRAFSAIVDSNLTTILAAFILIQFDSGPIKGFAMTLIIGIASSMFTSLFMTRVFFEKWFENRKNSTLTMSQLIGKPKIPFIDWSKPFIVAFAFFSLFGAGLLWQARSHIFGMDFVGGYAFTLNLQTAEDTQAKNIMKTALANAGLKAHSFDVRELGSASRLKVYLSHSLDEKGALFHGKTSDSDKLLLLGKALKSRINLTDNELAQIESTWTSVSGQLSNSMRMQAILGLGFALVGILIYLALRFEWLFSLASVLSLGFDVIVSIAAIGWLRLIGLPMQIDLQAIGAIMTIIGYALNDKIIVFDRIREDRKGASLTKALVEGALRSTLSRTLMTSGTTLLVLLVLDFFGGASLLSFSMIMTVGVIVGTLSSLFVAPAILLNLFKALHKK